MKLRLADFKEGVPVKVHETYDPKQLDLEFVDLKYLKPLDLHGIVEKGPDTLTFRGDLKSEIEHTCGRCLKTIERPLDNSFELYYETAGKEIIETIDDLREILILDHPLAFVCREDCLGLCPECGINKNESTCDCNVNTHPNLYTSLKDIWTKRKKENSHGKS